MIDLTDSQHKEYYGKKHDFTKWVVLRNEQEEYEEGLFYIAPKIFWENNKCVPDWHSGIKIKGFRECMEHCFKSNKLSDNNLQKLLNLGFALKEFE
jgi:hypothetical protein